MHPLTMDMRNRSQQSRSLDSRTPSSPRISSSKAPVLAALTIPNTCELSRALPNTRRVEEARLETDFRYPRALRNKHINVKSTTNNNNSQPHWNNGNTQSTISVTATTSTITNYRANEKFRPTTTKPAGWVGHWINPEDRPAKRKKSRNPFASRAVA
ncbi:hypothetical protein BDW66DRAFT_128306 [Aspergillus desertorum]